MHFHLFGPPVHHLLPIVLSSALAFAAGAYFIARHVPVGISRLGEKLKHNLAGWRASAHDAPSMFARALSVRNSTGNVAFDEYRAATLLKLEEDGAEFRSFLDGLRRAKDKTEFDAFIKDKREPDLGSPHA